MAVSKNKVKKFKFGEDTSKKEPKKDKSKDKEKKPKEDSLADIISRKLSIFKKKMSGE